MRLTHVPVYDYIVDTLGNQLKPTKYDLIAGVSGVDWNIGTRLKRRIVEIGAWNMDTEETHVTNGVAFPLVNSCISVDGIIYTDPDEATQTIYPIPMGVPFLSTGKVQLSILKVIDNQIHLVRLTAGAFDTTAFDSVAINRGYVVFTYIVP